WWVAIAALGIAASGCRKTTLELTAHGGFAYVRNDDGTGDIGFMKSVNNARCTVTQFGVDLRIDDGTIVSPKDSPTMMDVSNAAITFENIGRGAVTLTGNGLSSPPKGNASTMPPQPHPRTRDDDWKDIYWVPHTRLSYLSQRLDPNWRKTKVDGLVSLAGGSISGGSPSDGASVNGVWEFKRKSDKVSMTQAMTDRTRYRTAIRGTARG